MIRKKVEKVGNDRLKRVYRFVQEKYKQIMNTSGNSKNSENKFVL